MINLDILKDLPPEVLVQWVNNPVTKKFFEYQRAELRSATQSVMDEDDLIRVGRLQGEMKRIEKTLALESILKPKK